MNERVKSDIKLIEYKQELTTVRINKIDLIILKQQTKIDLATQTINQNLTEILKAKDTQKDVQESLHEGLQVCKNIGLNMKLTTANTYKTERRLEKFKYVAKNDGRSTSLPPFDYCP